MPKISKPIPPEVVEFLEYSEGSPSCLIWSKIVPRSKITQGSPAGYCDAKGRWVVKYKGSLYKAHRIVWYLHHLTLDPNLEVDHIDRNPRNNLVSNLRLSTTSQNNQNKVILSTKKSELPKGINHSMSPGTNEGYLVARVYNNGSSVSRSSYSLSDLEDWIQEERLRQHGAFANNG